MASTTRLRLAILELIVGCVALAIGARLYQVQVVRSDGLRARAEDQHQSRVIVPAMRGAIIDRNGRPLAMSRETRSLYAHPQKIQNSARVAELLAPVIGRSTRELLQSLRSDRAFVYLERFLEPAVANRVEALGITTPDDAPFGFENEPRRAYPLNELAVHVIGFATIDGDGVEGIEKEFDEALKGDPKIYLLLKDGRADGMRRLISEPSKRPSDVVLTLDVVLQHIVERELERAMRSTRARGASAVLLDPSTGEVLALANRPSVDANRFGQAPPGARRNRAAVDRYEPGSTFKVVTMAAALDLGRVHPSQRIYCERGAWDTGERVIHDVSPHETLTLEQILIESSNIGMAKVVMSMKPSELHAAITRFGFGDVTGIELPGENAGYLRPVREWSGYSQASLAFGQEIGVTTLQMASALAVIANEGVLVPPRVVLGMRDPEGRLHRMSPPPARRVVGRQAARAVASMMDSVVRQGTGRLAAVPGYHVAGKSGTAQKYVAGQGYSDTEYVASFGGFAPLDDPRLVLLVVIDAPHGDAYHGGQAAAPVFARIMSDALRYVRAPSEDPGAPVTTAGGDTLLTMGPAR